MSRKRKTLVFGAVWIVLFAGTFVVHRSWASANSDSASSDSADSDSADSSEYEKYTSLVTQATRIRLDGIARRSSDLSIATLDGDSDNRLAVAFLEHAKTINKPVFECLRDATSKSVVNTNYFEVSFDARPLALAPEGDATVAISNVIIERSTIEFTPREQDCFTRMLEGLQLQSDRSQHNRFVYVFCITGRYDR
jgi:hypothetical protein